MSARPAPDVARPAVELDAADLGALEAAPARAPELEVGVVAAVTPGLVVDLGSRAACPATRAKSCLVAPDAGDRVLCAHAAGRVYVIAVLEGARSAPTRLVAEGDLRVEATGDVDVVAGPAGTLRLAARELRARAKVAAAAFDDLGLVGRRVEATVDDLALVAARVEARAERLVTRAKAAFRFVEGLDQVRAAVVDVRAEGLAAVRGETALVAARAVAKLDGEQVKIG